MDFFHICSLFSDHWSCFCWSCFYFINSKNLLFFQRFYFFGIFSFLGSIETRDKNIFIFSKAFWLITCNAPSVCRCTRSPIPLSFVFTFVYLMCETWHLRSVFISVSYWVFSLSWLSTCIFCLLKITCQMGSEYWFYECKSVLYIFWIGSFNSFSVKGSAFLNLVVFSYIIFVEVYCMF